MSTLASFDPARAAFRANGRALTAPVADRVAIALLCGAVALALLTSAQYGITWDEDLLKWNGELALQYYLSLLGWSAPPNWNELYAYGDLYNYGTAFDLTAAAANRLSPLGVYETRHLLNALVGVIGMAGCWRLGRLLGGPRAGCIALLLLMLTPNYYGHMFNNPKDIPFAAGGVWTLYYIVRILPSLPRPPWSLVIKLGLASGTVLGVRAGGLVFLCYFGLALGLSAVWQGAAAGQPGAAVATALTSIRRVMAPVAAIAAGVMLLFWPWAHRNPVAAVLGALAAASHQRYPYDTLFDGELVQAGDLPWQYLPVHVGLKLPELELALLVAAALLGLAAVARSVRRRLPVDRAHAIALLLVAFAIMFPVGYAVAIRAVLFDGMRHFIFVLPPIAIAAGIAADRGLEFLSQRRWRAPVYAALGVYAALHLAIMVRLHPDQYVYYNALTGGVEGAQRRFKLDYWANSYAEDVRGLETYLRRQYGPAFARQRFKVGVCGPPQSAAYYFPPNFVLTAAREADFFIAFTDDNCGRATAGRVVYRVERMGAVLSVVIDRRDVVRHQAASPDEARRPELPGIGPLQLPFLVHPHT